MTNMKSSSKTAVHFTFKYWPAWVALAAAAAILWSVNAYQHRLVRRVPAKNPVAAQILRGAKAQIGTRYDASYQRLAYPGGDMPDRTGACTDIVIRALRSAGWDLQVLVHEDMAAHSDHYPRRRDEPTLDTSIDHRRVPNLACYLSRHAAVLTRNVEPNLRSEWQPGDIVVWKTVFGRDHIGLISDGIDASGLPLVIHNEYGCVEESCLTRWRIVGHYRIPSRL